MLTELPFAVLENITVELALAEPLGPPKHLVALLGTCRAIYDSLAFHVNPHLYARIFRCKFDTRAAVRRLGERCARVQNLADQLKVYCVALRRIRGGDIAAESVEDDMWSALFMLLENDGKNEEQLEWAGLRGFIDRYVRNLLFVRSEETSGWPAESRANALALWLMWFTTDEGEYWCRRPYHHLLHCMLD
jgi:hypothetical protein